MEFGYYNKAEYDYMVKKISSLVDNGNESFILYPCGNVSAMAEKIISKLGGITRFCIDNYNGSDILKN